MLKNSTKLFFGRIALVLATVVATVCSADAATATWDANTEADVAGYRLSYGTLSGVHTTSINVGKVTSYTFNPPAGARYYVVVQAYNAAGVLSAKSAEVIFDVPVLNRAPSLTQPANQTSFTNANALLTLTAADPDGQRLTFAASGLPPGLSINSATGSIAGIALTRGTYTVTVRVTDGSLWATRTFTWTVVDKTLVVVNLQPLDATLMADHNNYGPAEWLVAYTFPANQVMGAILMKFNLSQIPANAEIQSAVLNLFMTASDGFTAEVNYTMSLHQVLTRNPDIARATGSMANAFSTWTANPCCYGGFPIAQADISYPRSAAVVNRTPGIKTWDATALVRAWLASPSINYGLVLNADITKNGGRYRMFGSVQDPSPDRRPFLRVTYALPVAAPGSP